ncbi:MAG: helix-turn-helix domain-containing protein [Pseudomonadota bacterium]
MKELILTLSQIADNKALLARQETQFWEKMAHSMREQAHAMPREYPKPKPPAEPFSDKAPVQNIRKAKLYLRVKEAAEAMGVSKGKLYEEIKAGNIKAKKSGGTTLISTLEIERWFDELPSI